MVCADCASWRVAEVSPQKVIARVVMTMVIAMVMVPIAMTDDNDDRDKLSDMRNW